MTAAFRIRVLRNLRAGMTYNAAIAHALSDDQPSTAHKRLKVV